MVLAFINVYALNVLLTFMLTSYFGMLLRDTGVYVRNLPLIVQR